MTSKIPHTHDLLNRGDELVQEIETVYTSEYNLGVKFRERLRLDDNSKLKY